MKALILATLFLLGLCATSRADAAAATVIILDASGSMAAREPDGRSKLDAARKILVDTLRKWPADGRLALMAYGHRRKADCSDIETLVELAPVAVEPVLEKLKPLKARGKTPLSQSLRQAAARLPANGGSIVLVSDGIETCNADPCAVAEELRKNNPAVTIHVVGFGLAKGEAAQLACIARNAGGKFFDAGDAPQLAETLNSIKAEIAAVPPVVESVPDPAPPMEPASAPEPKIVRVGLAAVIPGLGPIVDAPVRWSVADEKGGVAYAGESRALSLDLAEGAYEATALAANAQGKARIAVTGQEGQDFDVEIDAGRLDLALVANKSAGPFSDLEAVGVEWTLDPLEGQGEAEIPGRARPSLLLAPGRYKIGARLKGMEASAVAVVVPGAPTEATLDLGLGTVVLEAVLDGDAQPIQDETMMSWRIGEGEDSQTITGQARPRLVLPQGRYPVMLTIAGAEIPGSAEVASAEERVARVVVGGGELVLSARLSAHGPSIEDWRDAFWTLAPVTNQASSDILEMQEAAPTVPLPPGRWLIGLRSGTVTVQREIMVKPGERIAMDIDLGGARLTVRATPASGENAANTVYSVFALDAAGASVAAPTYEAGSSEEAGTILAAGKWRVVASDSDGRKGQTDIELQEGEERSLGLILH